MADNYRVTAPSLLVYLMIVAGGLAPAASAQSIPPRQVGGSVQVPAWVTRPPTSDTRDYSFVGTATSASESQATGVAHDDAVRKAVTLVGTRLFEDPTVATSFGIDALSEYVRKVGRMASQYVRPNPTGGYSAYALLQLNRGFVEPSTVRQYAPAPIAVQQQAATALGYLLVPSDVGPKPVTKRTQVRMANLRQGNFYLYFSIASAKGQGSIRLDQIQVFDDGSAGATTWRFDVLVNGQKKFSTPIAAD